MTRIVYHATWTDGVRCGYEMFNEVIPGGREELEARKYVIVTWHQDATRKIFGKLISPWPELPQFILVVEDYLDFQI